MRLFIYEDDDLLILNLRKKLQKYKISLTRISSHDDFLSHSISSEDIVLIDLNIHHEKLAGLNFLRAITGCPAKKVILTSVRDELILQNCLEHGADDVFVKTDSLDELINEIIHFKDKNLASGLFQENRLNEQYKLAKKFFLNGEPVILLGETGVGKSHLAQNFHSSLGSAPFVAVNCSAITETLAESLFFGHQKGAFTGATSNHRGYLEEANTGTLFLDEVSCLPLSIQAKLLKALEEKSFYPVGLSKPIQSDFRIISATNEDLGALVKLGRFREDLFYRLNGFSFTIPPLRYRKRDLLNFVQKELNDSSKKLFLQDDAVEYLCSLSYKGNYRDLKKLLSLMKNQLTGLVKKEQIVKIVDETNFYQVNEDLYLKLYELCKEYKYKDFINHITEKVIDISSKNLNGHVVNVIKELGLSRNKFYSIKKDQEQYERRNDSASI